MTDDKTHTNIDALVDEEAKTTGLTPAEIKGAIQNELAARAATRILDKVDRGGKRLPGPTF